MIGANEAGGDPAAAERRIQVNLDKIGPFDNVIDFGPLGQAPQGTTITIYVGW